MKVTHFENKPKWNKWLLQQKLKELQLQYSLSRETGVTGKLACQGNLFCRETGVAEKPFSQGNWYCTQGNCFRRQGNWSCRRGNLFRRQESWFYRQETAFAGRETGSAGRKLVLQAEKLVPQGNLFLVNNTKIIIVILVVKQITYNAKVIDITTLRFFLKNYADSSDWQKSST